MLHLFNFVFSYVPGYLAAIYVMFEIEWGYQILVLAIELFLIQTLLLVLIVIEQINPQKLFTQDNE